MWMRVRVDHTQMNILVQTIPRRDGLMASVSMCGTTAVKISWDQSKE